MTAQTAANNAPTAYVCRHIFTLGRRCGAPCLQDEEFCFYHYNNRRKPKVPITTPDAFEMPSIEDGPAIQLAIQDVLCRLAANQIDDKRAGKLLYGLQIAAHHHARLERNGTGCPIHGAPQLSNPRPGNSTAKSGRDSDRDRPAHRLPQPIPILQTAHIVQDVICSPTYGSIAPALEYGLPEPEEECEPSLASIINTYLNSPPPPEPVELEKRPYDVETLQLLRRTLATTANPETAARIRKALEEEALIPGHNLHIQACAETVLRSALSVPRSKTKRHRSADHEERTPAFGFSRLRRAHLRLPLAPSASNLGQPSIPHSGQNGSRRSDILVKRRTGQTPRTRAAARILQDPIPRYHNQNGPPHPPRPAIRYLLSHHRRRTWLPHRQ